MSVTFTASARVCVRMLMVDLVCADLQRKLFTRAIDDAPHRATSISLPHHPRFVSPHAEAPQEIEVAGAQNYTCVFICYKGFSISRTLI